MNFKETFFDGQQLKNIIKSIRSTLINVKNQDLLKLLYYDVVNPFEQPDLTIKQLVEIVNELDNEKCRFFQIGYTGQVEQIAKTQLRVFLNKMPLSISNGQYLADTEFYVYIMTHRDNRIVQGKGEESRERFNRFDLILIEILTILNGKYIDGIGTLYYSPKMPYTFMEFKENFVGGILCLTTKTT